jgi:hypothetical protein
MTEEGQPLTEIVETIDRKYGHLRENRTPTPLPPLEGGEPEQVPGS